MVGNVQHHPLPLYRHASDLRAKGRRVVLGTILEASCSAMRCEGAHLVICDQGTISGLLSDGCLQSDLVFQSFETLRLEAPQLVQYGPGTRYGALRLPYGEHMVLLLTPDPTTGLLEMGVDRLSARKPFEFCVTDTFALSTDMSVEGLHLASFTHKPILQLIIIGAGPEVLALADLAKASGFDICVLTPEQFLFFQCRELGASVVDMNTACGRPELHADRWTAIVYLFHEHEQDDSVLSDALQTDAFYVGALGSERCQSDRLYRLRLRGLSEAQLARLRGPIGLVPAMRDPQRLAISILADILEAEGRRIPSGKLAPASAASTIIQS